MGTLTEKQLDILNYIKHHVKTKGFQPSSREMAKHFKVSSPAIQHSLNAIEKKRLY